MRTLLKNASVFNGGSFSVLDISIEKGRITALEKGIVPSSGDTVFDFNNCLIFPGLADVHVHLREPGFSYKETIATGTAAAAAGGYTDVCAMPNLNPAPDSLENLAIQLEIIKNSAKIRVHPYACITSGGTGRGELVDFRALSEQCAGFSDDGKGVQSEQTMKEAMRRIGSLGKIIAAHCEDESLLHGGYIHEGKYAGEHGHLGISSESEWRQIERDVELVAKTGCDYHICHVSTRNSVEIIRRAKKRGLPVSCETAPHYLIFSDEELQEHGRFKMNPPLRSPDDRAALIEGIADGTIDMIATDHAPHSDEEKSRGLKDSVMGIPGLETALPAIYTKLVCENIISAEKMVELMSTVPRARFGLGYEEIEIDSLADLTVFNPRYKYYVSSNEHFTMSKETPFEGMELYGKTIMTICGGKLVYGGEC